MNKISLYGQALVYIAAGVNHFLRPKIYLALMPPYLPAHQQLVDLSGIAEIGLGLGLLFPLTRPWAAWGLILLLIAVFPANVHMAMADTFARIPAWIRWGRLPIQGLLIAWAYHYTR
ncbi:DoxX family protein [Spirosoma luteolum]